jgi:hypothetical protein
MELFKERNIEVVKGYFQTIDYFDANYKKETFESFTFLPGILERSHKLIEEIKLKRGTYTRKVLLLSIILNFSS